MAPHSDNCLNHPSRQPDPPARGTDIALELRYLVRSAEPAVVFSSLAHLCVPMFSDACTVDIVEHGEIAYRIDYTRPDVEYREVSADQDFDRALCTPFAWAGTGPDDTAYAGVMTHRWRTRQPNAADAARAGILARHGVVTVSEERRFGENLHRQDQVEHLRAVVANKGLAGAANDPPDLQLLPRLTGARDRRGTYQPWRCRAVN